MLPTLTVYTHTSTPAHHEKMAKQRINVWRAHINTHTLCMFVLPPHCWPPPPPPHTHTRARAMLAWYVCAGALQLCLNSAARWFDCYDATFTRAPSVHRQDGSSPSTRQQEQNGDRTVHDGITTNETYQTLGSMHFSTWLQVHRALATAAAHSCAISDTRT